MNQTLQAVWPIIDLTRTYRELVAEGEYFLPVVAIEANALIEGPAEWAVRDASDVPGWEAYDGLVLVANVAAEARPQPQAPKPSRTEVGRVAKRCNQASMDAEVKRHHAAGMDDGVIAFRMGLSRRTVLRSRQRQNLPVNYAPQGLARAR
jgi:hypothetical protein